MGKPNSDHMISYYWVRSRLCRLSADCWLTFGQQSTTVDIVSQLLVDSWSLLVVGSYSLQLLKSKASYEVLVTCRGVMIHTPCDSIQFRLFLFDYVNVS